MWRLEIDLIFSSFLSERRTAAHITHTWIINSARYRLHRQSMKMKCNSFYRQLEYLVGQQREQKWAHRGFFCPFWKLIWGEILEAINVKWKRTNVVSNPVRVFVEKIYGDYWIHCSCCTSFRVQTDQWGRMPICVCRWRSKVTGSPLAKTTLHVGQWETVNRPWHFWFTVSAPKLWDGYFLLVSDSNTISRRLEITEQQSLSDGRGTADISTDWASESASVRAELRTVYLSKMGAADFFVWRNHRYVTLNLEPGPRLIFIGVWRLRERERERKGEGLLGNLQPVAPVSSNMCWLIWNHSRELLGNTTTISTTVFLHWRLVFVSNAHC